MNYRVNQTHFTKNINTITQQKTRARVVQVCFHRHVIEPCWRLTQRFSLLDSIIRPLNSPVRRIGLRVGAPAVKLEWTQPRLRQHHPNSFSPFILMVLRLIFLSSRPLSVLIPIYSTNRHPKHIHNGSPRVQVIQVLQRHLAF